MKVMHGVQRDKKETGLRAREIKKKQASLTSYVVFSHMCIAQHCPLGTLGEEGRLQVRAREKPEDCRPPVAR